MRFPVIPFVYYKGGIIIFYRIKKIGQFIIDQVHFPDKQQQLYNNQNSQVDVDQHIIQAYNSKGKCQGCNRNKNNPDNQMDI
jgi:hypothetical protein